MWVLVESGKTDADNAAAAALTKRLRYLGQILQIPPIDPDDPSSQLGPGPPLAAKFSMLRVRSGDAAEQPFLAMLAGPKGAAALRDGPWFATVFGRGRVLGAWPAADFGDEQIDEICMFLLGACSCQVKRENPGWDLLLDADWDGALQAMGLPATDAPTPVSNTLEAAASAPALETVTITPAAPAAVPAADAVWPNFTSPRVVAPMMLLVLGAGLGWWIVRNQS